MMNKILAMIVLVGLVGLLGFSFQGIQIKTGSPSEQGVKYGSAVCIDAVLDGEPLHLGCNHNVLTNYGKNATRNLLIGGNSTSFNYIGLDNATNITDDGAGGQQPTAASANMSGEFTGCGVNRQGGALTIQEVGSAGNWSIAKTFTATCDNIQTNVTGLFNSSVGNCMFAGNNFTSVTLQTSDTLAVTWYLWIT